MPITINGKIFPDFSSAVTFIKSARPDIEDPEGYVAAIARDQEEEEEEEKENTGSSYNRELVGSTNKTMVIGQPTGNVNRDAFTDGTKTKPLPITTSKMKNGYGVGTEGGLRHTRTGQKVPRSLSPKRIKSRKIRLLRFVYVNTKVAKEGGKDCEICKQYDGHVYEVNSPNRPVIPRLEPTRKRKGPFTHPNCECRWARPIEAYIQEQYAEESAVGIGEAGAVGNSMRIHGTLAYAGTSHNNRIYLPETLADGDKKVLPLIFNHGTTDGLESDAIWNNLPDDIRRRITNHERIKIGSIELRWDKTRLTLFYDAVVTHEFFQSEIRAGKMSVSLGLLFEYDGKKVCDLECYTIVRRGQWNEVSLVYSPGFPIATIETHEMRLGQTALEYAAREFDEDEHPRGGDSEHPGRFSDKSGGGGGDGKGKDKGKDKSDDIWKKTNMPAKLSDEHKKNLDDAWKSIPAQYTEGIEKVLIRVGKGWSGSGSYSPIKNKVNVTAGEIKPSAILHHEVHHHMWHNKRTEAQRQKWRDGVKRIMDMDRKSPTIYSDSYTPRSEMNRIKSLVIKRKKFNDKLKAGEMNVDMCYPDYTAYKKIIRTDLKFKEKMGLPMSQDLRVIMADTKKMKDEYDKLSKDGRRSLAYKNYDEKVEGISNRTKAIKYSEIFYNEVHSEVGSYINDKEAKLTRDTMSFNIKKYVTLYREVFGTTS